MSTKIRNITLPGTPGTRQPWRRESQYLLLAGLRALVALHEGTRRAYESVKSLGRFVRSPRDFSVLLLFMAEAFVAAQGYLILPSVTRSHEGKRECDWLRNLDL